MPPKWRICRTARACCGWDSNPGWRTGGDGACASSARPTATAFSLAGAAGHRGCADRAEPFRASCGEAFAPCSTEYPQSASRGRAHTATHRAWRRCGPPWPWWRSAAPGSRRGRAGCWRAVVARVESTTVIGPPIAPTSSRSTMSTRGFAGVSAITSIVRRPDRLGERTRTRPSTKVTSMPKRWHTPGEELHRAPVQLLLGDHVVTRGAQAQHHRRHRPHPGRERAGASAPSISATACSKAATVGLP